MTPLPELLTDWLPRQRWFADKGRPIEDVRLVSSAPLSADEPSAELTVLGVDFADGAGSAYYQVLVGRRRVMLPELEHAAIGWTDETAAYDGLWDAELTTMLLDRLAQGGVLDGVRFVPEPGAQIPRGLAGRVLLVEQSNTSVAYGEQSILKMFRRVAPGVHPDLELHRALRRVGCEHVAQLQAAIEGTVGAAPATFGLLQDFAANSADGWAMALISVRDLFAEGDLHADEVGGDFAGEACRLGEAVAAVHADLARALGTHSDSGPTVAELVDGIGKRLDLAVRIVPALTEFAPAIRAACAELAGSTMPTPTQRIHGDLHLGQTLRTPTGWLLIDFEGEPSKPLAERSRPDSTLRDVAGMLRSFDYAAYHQLADWGDGSELDSQLSWRAGEWSMRNRSAFCEGYAARSGADPRSQAALLLAYELDKAVYEAVYETRNRPTWVSVPLRSLRRLLTDDPHTPRTVS